MSGRLRRIKPLKITGAHDPAECFHKINGKFIHQKLLRAIDDKEVLRLCDGDGTRELVIPNREPTELPGIWPKSEFQRLQRQGHVVTQKDKMAMIEEAAKQKQRVQDESDYRKELLKKSQLTQKAKQGSKLSEAETEAAQKNLYVLQRAFELRQEQEDEIKKANGLILATKCLAIREAQVAEKELIEKEMAEEEYRLDMMMEQHRQNAIKAEEMKKVKHHALNQIHVREMAQQIKENEVRRLVEAERKEEESRNINRALIAMQREDAEKLRQKRLVQEKTQQDLKRANEEIEQYKIIQREEQRIAELRVQQFMQNKAEREAAREAELAEAVAAKERETARLRAQQEKAADSQAAADELNALRVQEQVEKKWREAEVAAAKKRKDQAEELKRGRMQQVEDLRKAQALEIERDEFEFLRVAKVQKELYEKEQQKKREKREAAVNHRKELLKQINEKERERINKLKEKFEEGKTLLLEQEVRNLHINGVMKKKLERLRADNIPEQYIKDVERQLKVT